MQVLLNIYYMYIICIYIVYILLKDKWVHYRRWTISIRSMYSKEFHCFISQHDCIICLNIYRNHFALDNRFESNLYLNNNLNINKIIFRLIIYLFLIWNQTDVRSVPYRSENGKYNLISVWLNKIFKKILCVLFSIWKEVKMYSLECEVKRASIN